MTEKLLTVGEAAMRMSCSTACIYSLIGAGRIACHRIGMGRGCIRISESQMQAFLDRNEQRGREELELPPPPRGNFKHLRV